MLTTWILFQGGYDLGKFYTLEEFYAKDLQNYYDALVTHPNHNYYLGRNEAEITSWLAYFLDGMATVFERVVEEVQGEALDKNEDQERMKLLRSLDHRVWHVLGLFTNQEYTSFRSR